MGEDGDTNMSVSGLIIVKRITNAVKVFNAYKADNSTFWVQGRYAIKVLSFEKEPGLKHMIPVYLNAFCSLLSPKTICTRADNENKIVSQFVFTCITIWILPPT